MSSELPLDCDWQSQLKTQDAFWHMQKNQVACDLVFEVGKQKERVGAHSFVLMSRSTRFFHDHLTVSGSQFIAFPEVTSITFKEFLRKMEILMKENGLKGSETWQRKFDSFTLDGYLYTDYLDYTNWKDTLYLANMFEVKPLIEDIFDKQIRPEQAHELCCLLLRHQEIDGYLEYKCLKYVFDNPKPVFESNCFYFLSQSFIRKLLSSEYLVCDENLICRAVLEWAQKTCIERLLEVSAANKKKVLGNVLYEIRFPLLSQDFFTEHISEQGLLDDAEEVKILKYYLSPNRPVGNDFKFKTTPRRAPEEPFQYIPLKFERWRPSAEGCEVVAPAAVSTEIVGPFELGDSNAVESLHSLASAADGARACTDGRPVVRRSDQPCKSQIGSFRKELETDQWNMERFSEGSKATCSGWGYKKETVDAIAVVSSADIAVIGIQLYGLEKGKKMTGRLKIMRCNQELYSQEFDFTCERIRCVYDIFTKENIKFVAKEEYHILVDMEGGSNGYYGKNGHSEVTVADVSFSFKASKYSTNQTDVHMGQIFGFTFKKFKPVSIKYGLHFDPDNKPKRLQDLFWP